jgi:hypothetical protein
VIIKGNPRCDAAFWAGHLMRTDQNESVSLSEVRGLSGSSVKTCLAELEAIAQGTRTKNGFYVASLNPRDDERLTPEQWELAADTLERQLGLDGQARFVVEHEKEGRTHRHVVWGRIDPDTMKAIPADFNYQKHELAARAIEQELGLAPVDSVLVKDRGTERPERRPKDWEGFRAADTQIDPQAMKAEITALWQTADSGLAFKSALHEAGYILARGDRRDFCVIDAAGDEHSLARRISGVKAAEIRARMGDVDRDGLPSVEAARQMARDAAGSGDATSDAGPLPPELAARCADWTQAPSGAPADWQAADRASFASSAQGTTADWQPAKSGQGSDQREGFTQWERFTRAMRAVKQGAIDFLHDETSGRPEEERGLFARLFDAGRSLWMGFRLDDEMELAEGVADAAALARDLTKEQVAAAPETKAPETAHAPPDEPPGDRSRPGALVESPEPDRRPQQGTAGPLGPQAQPDPFDVWAAQAMRDAPAMGAETAHEHSPDRQPEPEPGDWDIEP